MTHMSNLVIWKTLLISLVILVRTLTSQGISTMELTFLERLDKLEERFHKFRMSGHGDVRVFGSLKEGHAVFIEPKGAGIGEGGTGPPNGACCVDEVCTVLTETECSDVDGVWHVGVPCTPNPCVGACCNAGDCSLTTEGDCVGVFQGGGT